MKTLVVGLIVAALGVAACRHAPQVTGARGAADAGAVDAGALDAGPLAPPVDELLVTRITERVLSGDLRPPEAAAASSLALVNNWDWYRPVPTPFRALISNQHGLVLVSDGLRKLDALDVATGAVKWSSPDARLPLTIDGDRVLATAPVVGTRQDLVWLDVATGQVRQRLSGFGENSACPALNSDGTFCATNVRAISSDGRTLLASGIAWCSWHDRGGVAPSGWECLSKHRLLALVDDQLTTPTSAQLPDLGLECANGANVIACFSGPFRYGDQRIEQSKGLTGLFHIDAHGTRRRLPVPFGANFQETRSADGRLIGVLRDSRRRAGFFEWTLIDISTGKLTDLAEPLPQVTLNPIFLASAHAALLLGHGYSTTAAITDELTAYSLQTGARIWKHAWPIAAGPREPPVPEDDGRGRQPMP